MLPKSNRCPRAWNRRNWTLTLTPEEVREGVGADMQYQTSGKTSRPRTLPGCGQVDFWSMAASTRQKANWVDENAMMEHFIRSVRACLHQGCVCAGCFPTLPGPAPRRRCSARLASVYYLLAGSIVEAILELTLGPVRAGRIHVRFRGRRRQRYANEPPATIQIEGDCSVE